MDVNKSRNLFEVFDSRDFHKSILVVFQFLVSFWYDMFQEHTKKKRAFHAYSAELTVWK